jgi:serine protease Do
MIERLRRSTVQVISEGGGGAGVVWDANGTVVTNAHVLRGRSVQIVDSDGNTSTASAVKLDRDRDLAILTSNLRPTPAEIAIEPSLKPGQIVIAVGNPNGRIGAVTMGVIHSAGRFSHGSRVWIQSDIHLAPGNSGGLLATADSKVIGVNTLIFRGLGLSIPAAEVQSFLSGETGRIMLGVRMVPVPEGLVVVGIERGGLAERAGMLVGDLLRCTEPQLRILLDGVKSKGSADILVARGRVEKTLSVHLTQEARAA